MDGNAREVKVHRLPSALKTEQKEQRALIEIEKLNRMALPRTHKGVGDLNVNHLLHPVRVGAMDNENIPSRMNDKLHYRDGRIEDVSNS